MMDHLFGLLLIGLGLRTPALTPRPAVMGDTTEQTQFIESPMPTGTTGTSGRTLEGDRKEIRTDTKNILKDRKTIGTDMKNGDFKAATASRKDLRTDIKGRQDDIRTLIEDREDLASRSPELFKHQKELEDSFSAAISRIRLNTDKQRETARTAFTKRLAVIKDADKKARVQKLDTLIADANTKRVQAITDQLNKLDQIVTKLVAKSTALKAGGVDTTSVDSLISAAQTAITAAKTALQTQASKQYVIGITTETNVSSDVGRTRSQLESDLSLLKNTVIVARQSVAKAISALAQLGGEGSTQNPTSSSSGEKGQ